MTTRAIWVDYAKGIGIILVVYGHVARGVHSAGLPFDEYWFRQVDSVIYSFHMPLFFFLSGLFFPASVARQGASGVLVAKLRTVAWPYLLWSIVQGTVEVMLSRYTNGSVEIAEIANLLWQPRAQFWFLYALFFISVFVFPFYRVLSVRWQPTVLLLACLAWLFAEHLPGGIPVGFVTQYTLWFACGAWFVRLSGDGVTRQWQGLLTFLGIVFAGMFAWLYHGPMELTYNSGPRWLSLPLAFAAVMAVVGFSRWLKRYRLEWLAALGRASLAIYVMHVLAGSGARIVLQKLLGIESVFIHLLIGTVCGLLTPFLALRLAERFGLVGWLGIGDSGTRRA